MKIDADFRADAEASTWDLECQLRFRFAPIAKGMTEATIASVVITYVDYDIT